MSDLSRINYLHRSVGKELMNIDLSNYKENKTRRMRRILWYAVNCSLFRISPSWLRLALLRVFGAEIGRSLIYRSVDIFAPWNLKVGDYSCIGPDVVIYNKAFVTIGDSTVISQNSYICTASHDVQSRTMEPRNKPIYLSNSVWVASRAIVLPGTVIEDGAVVAAGSVVVKKVPAWTVVGGNPARIIKKRVLA